MVCEMKKKVLTKNHSIDFEGDVAKLYERYKDKIFHHVYNDFLKSKDLRWDVVNEVFIIFLRKNNICDNFSELRKKFAGLYRVMLLEAIEEVIRKQKRNVFLIHEENIKDFYDKVKALVDKGYHEKEAKGLIVLEESLIRHRLVEKSGGEIEELSNPDKRASNSQENSTIVKDLKTKFTKFQAECFEKLREDSKLSELYDILVDYHFHGLNYAEIARKYQSTHQKIKRSVVKGMSFITACIKNKFGKSLKEVFC